MIPGYELKRVTKRGRPQSRDWIREQYENRVLSMYEEVLKVTKRYCLKKLPHEANDKDKWKRRLIQKTIPEICQKCGIRPGPKNTAQSWAPGFPEERVQEFTEAIKKWAKYLVNSTDPVLNDELAYRIVGFTLGGCSPAHVKYALSCVRPVKHPFKKTKPRP